MAELADALGSGSSVLEDVGVRIPSSAQSKLRGGVSVVDSFPKCLKCDKGVLIPLSDYGRDGATIRYKAWVCTNPECGYHIRIDNGEISIGTSIGFSKKF